MNRGDTSLGGEAKGFPETSLSFPTPGFEALCARYWKPIYHYYRAGWGKSNEDAKDLTQAFLLWVMQGKALAAYLPDRGSFRAYLKTLLKRFAQHEEESRASVKRGGRVRIVDLEAADRFSPPVCSGDSPEKAFDRGWLRLLTEGAVERVRRRFAESGRSEKFRVFEEYDLGDPGRRSTYDEVARRLGLKESDVRNALFAVREEVRTEIRAELSTLAASRDLENEWDELLRP